MAGGRGTRALDLDAVEAPRLVEAHLVCVEVLGLKEGGEV